MEDTKSKRSDWAVPRITIKCSDGIERIGYVSYRTAGISNRPIVQCDDGSLWERGIGETNVFYPSNAK